MRNGTHNLFFLIAILILSVQATLAQTTEFTYQGSLKTGGAAANGNFDFEFALFDSATGGVQFGSTVVVNNITVTNGVFSVKLNFGNQFAAGANRFLEIRVKVSGADGFTVLAPRQSINSAPYAVRSLSAENATNANSASQLGGLSASGFIQNRNSVQTNSNFNISGTGIANVFDAPTYRLGGTTVLRAAPGNANLFMGLNSGNTTLTSFSNTAFGQSSGNSLTSGFTNAFFGDGAGFRTTEGSGNSFFGAESGRNNTLGFSNAFLGRGSGFNNTTGSNNSFFGRSAGVFNTTGSLNIMIGDEAGSTNTVGNQLTIIGALANVNANNLSNATAIGFRAFAAQNNSLVLGSIDGVNGATADTNVGIGTTAPNERLDIGVNGGNIIFGGANCPDGSVSIGLTGAFGNCVNYTLRGNGTDVLINRPLGGDILFRENNGSTQVRIRAGGALAITVLGSSGSTQLCRNASNEISTCSSSIRYKSGINNFNSGLSLIKKLRPVSFNWKSDNAEDFGLVAEEVAEIEPLLVTKNEKGETEGVKYDRVGVVLVNAVNEQQTQIEEQQKQLGEQKAIITSQAEKIKEQEKRLDRQQAELEALKRLVCTQSPAAEICKPKNRKE